MPAPRDHGGNVYRTRCRIDFSASINPLGMPERVRRAAEQAVIRCDKYPDPDALPLRKAIAGRELPQCPGEEYVLTGNGAAELIFALTAAVRPKTALLIAPDFVEYEQALRFFGCRILWYTNRREDGFRPGEDLLERISPEIDMIFFSVPNNPTAALPVPSLLPELVRKAEQCGSVLVVDECFNGLLDRPALFSVSGLLPEYKHLIVLKAFTKMYAMPGLRLGYALCADKELAAHVRSGLQPWNISVPAQAAGLAALQEEDFAAESRSYIAKERFYLREELSKLGYKVYPSETNYLFFEGPPDLGRKLEQEGIRIRDCSSFPGLRAGDWRIAVRTAEENRELIRACGA